MVESEELAPEVRSILETARERGGSRERISVEARSLEDAFDRARADGLVPLIAEIKPTSPTTAGEREVDPVDVAEAMVAGGAAALSVLTEPEHFGGTPEDLRRVRAAVDVPVLRKDFVLYEAQLDTVSADLVLLIARFVDDLGELTQAAQDRGFQVLVEAHTREEVQAAIEAGADVVGVNNRDLARLEVDLGTFERVAPAAPENVTLIAESGIHDTGDVKRMRHAGADGMLVGSAVMGHVDSAASTAGETDSPYGDIEAQTRRLTTAVQDD